MVSTILVTNPFFPNWEGMSISYQQLCWLLYMIPDYIEDIYVHEQYGEKILTMQLNDEQTACDNFTDIINSPQYNENHTNNIIKEKAKHHHKDQGLIKLVEL